MRSPSEKLTGALRHLQLCSDRDVRACEKRVRLLCHDLPDFDSVWLDALVQQKFLTPWQADMLLSGEPEHLQVGPYLLLEPIGRDLFRAVDRRSRRSTALRRLPAVSQHPDGEPPTGIHRPLADLISTVHKSGLRIPPSLQIPDEIVSDTADSPPGSLPCRPGHPNDSDSALRTEADSVERSASTPQVQPWVASAWVPGWSLDELLIRGGRLPWNAVAEIGRDLLLALAWLESQRLMHGDVVLRNVRVTPQGRAVLVTPFVRRLLNPACSLTAALTLKDCDGIAPEQVGTGRPPDSRSELYALGCLLWQLLSSRPVVLTADPVARLMKQKEHDIPDVRGPVPDCPEWMSRAIQAMTRRSPELRPASAAEVLKQWNAEVGGGCPKTRSLVCRMPDRSRRQRRFREAVPAATPRNTLGQVAMLSMALAAAVALGAWAGLLPAPLRVTSSVSQLLLSPKSSTSPNTTLASERLNSRGEFDEPAEADAVPSPLPQPDAAGRVALRPGQTYVASSLSHPQSITIFAGEADSSSAVERTQQREQPPNATIIVPEASEWGLRAPMIRLERITVVRTASPAMNSPENPPSPSVAAAGLLGVYCEQLHLQHCLLDARQTEGSAACLIWNAAPDATGQLELRNSILAGGGTGLRLQRPPAAMRLENVLLATAGAAVRCDFSKSDQIVPQVSLTQVTQRGGVSFLDTIVRDEGTKTVHIAIRSGESVLAPRQSLVRIAAPAGWPLSQFHVEFQLALTGNATIVPPDIEWGLFFDTQLRSLVRLRDQQVLAEALLIAEPHFFADDQQPVDSSTVRPPASLSSSFHDAGKMHSGLARYQLMDYDGPKLNDTMPGIRAELLPAEWTHERESTP